MCCLKGNPDTLSNLKKFLVAYIDGQYRNPSTRSDVKEQIKKFKDLDKTLITVLCQLKAHPLINVPPYGLEESPEHQLLLHTIRLYLAIAPCAFIRHNKILSKCYTHIISSVADSTSYGNLNLSVDVLLNNESISVCITWTHSGVSLRSHYALHVAHDGCQADPDYPGCESPRDLHTFQVFALSGEVNENFQVSMTSYVKINSFTL